MGNNQSYEANSSHDSYRRTGKNQNKHSARQLNQAGALPQTLGNILTQAEHCNGTG
ncbi:hypothetical protein D3C75_1320680 [compost metagenome]